MNGRQVFSGSETQFDIFADYSPQHSAQPGYGDVDVEILASEGLATAEREQLPGQRRASISSLQDLFCLLAQKVIRAEFGK